MLWILVQAAFIAEFLVVMFMLRGMGRDKVRLILPYVMINLFTYLGFLIFLDCTHYQRFFFDGPVLWASIVIVESLITLLEGFCLLLASRKQFFSSPSDGQPLTNTQAFLLSMLGNATSILIPIAIPGILRLRELVINYS